MPGPFFVDLVSRIDSVSVRELINNMSNYLRLHFDDSPGSHFLAAAKRDLARIDDLAGLYLDNTGRYGSAALAVSTFGYIFANHAGTIYATQSCFPALMPMPSNCHLSTPDRPESHFACGGVVNVELACVVKRCRKCRLQVSLRHVVHRRCICPHCESLPRRLNALAP